MRFSSSSSGFAVFPYIEGEVGCRNRYQNSDNKEDFSRAGFAMVCCGHIMGNINKIWNILFPNFHCACGENS